MQFPSDSLCLPKDMRLKSLIQYLEALKHPKSTFGLIILLFAIMLYSQSASFDYTYDDMYHISKNGITMEGIKGIPKILGTDYWYGSPDSVRGPEYRPLSLVMFASEWQLWGDNPHLYHALNVVLYAVDCLLVFLLLCKLFNNQNLLFPFICALLFTAHPIHTEVVDSIKSGDELLCFLFVLLSILFLLKSLAVNPAWLWFTFAIVFYFFSILSKETAVAYLLIVPLILYVFTKEGMKKIIWITCLYGVIIILFLVVRHNVLEGIGVDTAKSPLNNSLWATQDFIVQRATAFYVLLRYIFLLLIPHPLTGDYSIATIPLLQITDYRALSGIIVYSALTGYAVITILNNKKKDASPHSITNSANSQLLIAFAILFFLITLFPVSNLLYMIRCTMAERFLFMPSLGFCIILTFYLFKFSKTRFSIPNPSYPSPNSQFSPINFQFLFAILIILGLYSIKTITRSRYWKDNHTLFEHDVLISDRSARSHFNHGFDLLFAVYPAEKNAEQRNTDNDMAIDEFTKAIKYFPDYTKAYIYMGIACMNKNDYRDAQRNLEIALTKPGDINYVLFNKLGIVYSLTGQYEKSLSILDTAIKYYPHLAEAYNNKSFTYSRQNNFTEAITCGKKAIEVDSCFAMAYMNVGCYYGYMNDYTHALEYLRKAVSLDSLNPDPLFFLGVTYHKMGELEKGQQLIDKSKKMKQNLAITLP